MNSPSNTTTIVFILGIVLGSMASFIFLTQMEPSQDDLIAEFYAVENAVHVSPHGLRKDMDKGYGNFILVDLRSQEEYEKEHIIGAVNIPAYADPDTSAYGDRERIVNAFRELKAENPNREIIVYCYSVPCGTGRKIGGMLTEHDIYVKHLGIGWNEWRYAWEAWNHEHEWAITDVADYVYSGPEPGEPEIKLDVEGCKIDNEFGC